MREEALDLGHVLDAAAEADEARAADGNKLAELLAALELQSKPVQAPWEGDGCFYQGVVQRVGGDGAVDVRFDDGDVGRGVKVASLRDYDTPYSDEDSDNSDKPVGAEYADGDGGNNSGTASLAIIIPVVVAAVFLVAAILFLVRKRIVAGREHRRESMPTVGGAKAEAEAEAEA